MPEPHDLQTAIQQSQQFMPAASDRSSSGFQHTSDRTTEILHSSKPGSLDQSSGIAEISVQSSMGGQVYIQSHREDGSSSSHAQIQQDSGDFGVAVDVEKSKKGLDQVMVDIPPSPKAYFSIGSSPSSPVRVSSDSTSLATNPVYVVETETGKGREGGERGSPQVDVWQRIPHPNIPPLDPASVDKESIV